MRAEHAAVVDTAPPVSGFLDRLGDRVQLADRESGRVEVLRLRPELTASPLFEPAVRRRAEQLAGFLHPHCVKVRQIGRVSKIPGQQYGPALFPGVAGTGLVVCGFAALSRVQSLLAYYLVLGSFFAFGLGTMGGMASAKLVANWFVLQRGTAFGRATMGVSLSGLVMPLLATWLVTEHGWRVGCLVYALGTLLVVTPLVLRFVISRPEDVGQLPDGRRPQPDLPPLPAESERVWSARELVAHGDFWRIAIPFALALSTLSAVLIHLVPHAHELGIDGYRAGWILSASAGCGALGKVCFGSLVDRFDPRRVVWFSFGLQMLGLVLIRATHDYTGLLLGASLFGFSMGGVVPLQGAICGMAFGRQSFGSVMGSMGPVQVPLHAAGIPLLAWIRSASGSYDHAWELGIAVYALAALIVGGLRF